MCHVKGKKAPEMSIYSCINGYEGIGLRLLRDGRLIGYLEDLDVSVDYAISEHITRRGSGQLARRPISSMICFAFAAKEASLKHCNNKIQN